MRVLFCGDRNWTDREKIKSAMQQIKPSTIIEGEARGADSLSRNIAIELKIPVLKFPADWRQYGKAAGFIRNQQMLNEGKPDLVVAFHDNIEHSKGAANMMKLVQRAKILVILVTKATDVGAISWRSILSRVDAL